jgi:hypothetical protein
MVVNGKVFTLGPDITVGADDEFFIELAEASDGFRISNGERNGDDGLRYSRPGLDIQKLNIL